MTNNKKILCTKINVDKIISEVFSLMKKALVKKYFQLIRKMQCHISIKEHNIHSN